MSAVMKQKPVVLEERKNLLYSHRRRRSAGMLFILCVTAFAGGLIIAAFLKTIVGFRVSAEPGNPAAVASLMTTGESTTA